MSDNNAGHMNDTRAINVAQSYAQPETPSERCNNLRAKNRALLEENDKLRAALALWYQQPKGDHMSAEFKPGDVVRLKSGGPKMNIEEITEKGAKCTWFSGDYAQCEVFKEVTLELVGDSGRPEVTGP